MPPISILLPLALLSGGQGAPAKKAVPPVVAQPSVQADPRGMELLGQQIPLTKPQDRSKAVLPNDVLAWNGWGGGTQAAPSVFLADSDWTAVQDKLSGPPDASATLWRIKVFILRRTDLVLRNPEGLLTQQRASMEKSDYQAVLESLVRAARVFEAQSGGKLKVSFDVEEEPELWRQRLEKSGDAPFDNASLNNYIGPRVNGGLFEADDKKYRGPYHSVLIFQPGLNPVERLQVSVNGLPVGVIPTVAFARSPGMLTAQILRAESFAVSAWSATKGAGVTEAPNPLPNLPMPLTEAHGLSLDLLASTAPVTGDVFLSNGHLPSAPEAQGWSGVNIVSKAAISETATASLVKDDEKGTVLKVQFGGLVREGGISLPFQITDKTLTDTPFLNFNYKTSSKDVVGLGTTSAGERLGGVDLGVGPEGGLAAAIASDGAWHQVSIDLRTLPKDRDGHIDGLYIGTLPGANEFERVEIDPVTFELSGASFSAAAAANAVSVGPAPELASMTRAKAIRVVATQPTAPGALGAITTALRDPEDVVRLNALDVLQSTAPVELETVVFGAIPSLNPDVTESAVAALYHIGDDPAIVLLRQQLNRGAGDHAKAAAGLALAQKHDPAFATPISTLIATKSWQTRLDGAKAVGINGGPFAPVLLNTFLQESNPAIRLAAVYQCDPAIEAFDRMLLYNSVNDPSDVIRAESCIKLLQSSKPDFKKEGYRGTSDDSHWVRLMVLRWIALNPSADDRPALRQAVTNPDPEVRAAAVEALARSKDPVTVDEVANLSADKHPLVVSAMQDLAKAKNISITSP